jgi:hypothetical protein
MPNLQPLVTTAGNGEGLFTPATTLRLSDTNIPVPPPTLIRGTAGQPDAVYTVSVPISPYRKLALQGIYNVCCKFTVTTLREGAAGDILTFGLVGGEIDGPNLVRESDFVTTINLVTASGDIAYYTTNSVLYGAPPLVWAVFNYQTAGTPFAYEALITFTGYTGIGYIPNGEAFV